MPKHDHLHTLDITERYPEDLWIALNLAAEKHAHQVRKMSGEPYIAHPFGVLRIVSEVTDDRAVQIAAVLHDTVEDTDMTFEQIAEQFGVRVAHIVRGVTKDKSIRDRHERNLAYLTYLADSELSDEGSAYVALADKIHNATDTVRKLSLYGQPMWDQLSGGAEGQLWWNSSVLAIGRERLPGCPLNDHLAELIAIMRSYSMGARARTGAAVVA
ncbi:MAG: HD domain-containing protein [Candidatus Saccharimonas sp.]